MKSDLTHSALSVFEAILTDYLSLYPRDSKSILRDLERLESQSTPNVWTLFQNLAALDKLLIVALRDGRLPLDRPPLAGRKSRDDLRPEFLHSLWSRVLDTDATLRPVHEVDYFSVRFLRQVFNCFKKLEKEFTDEQLEEAVSDFVRTDVLVAERLSSPIGTRGSDLGLDLCHDFVSEPISALGENPGGIDDTLIYVSRLVVASFGSFDPWTLRPRHGPGVVADMKGGYKYHFPTWPRRLEDYFPYDWFGTHDLESDPSINDSEPASRLIAVPKDCNGPRLIAAEPVSFQWIQQGIAGWLDSGIRKSVIRKSITLRDQRPSQRRAKQGSLDGSLATIDLSSASDRVSVPLVKAVFDESSLLCQSMFACRSQMIRLLDGSFHRIRKFSTMGSALTFPVQSIIFTILSLVAILKVRKGLWYRPTLGELEKWSSEVTVYGDDIIIPVDAAEALESILGYYGLKVNRNKTFRTGRFRESCGGDYLDGVDITPIKIRRFPSATSPESVFGWVSLHNNCMEKGLTALARYVRSTTPFERNIREVSFGSGDFGFFTYDVPDNTHLPSKVNRSLFRREVCCLTLLQKVTVGEVGSKAPLLQYFSEAPEPTTKWKSGEKSKPLLRLKKRWVASEG